jgi:rhomboid family GlyGly-CTERM serine protease
MNLGEVVAFLVVCGLAWFCTEHAPQFIYARDAIGSGEIWRMVTGHLVHFSGQHLVANLAVFALLLGLAKRASVKAWMWLVFICPIALGVLLYVLRPELAAYGGLSGVLSAMFTFVAMRYAVERAVMAWLFRGAIALFSVKLWVEFVAGASVVGDLGDGVVVEPVAHAIGACLGVIPWLFDLAGPDRKQKGGSRRNRLTFFGAALHRPQINSLKAIRRNDRYSSVTSSNNSVKSNSPEVGK